MSAIDRRAMVHLAGTPVLSAEYRTLPPGGRQPTFSSLMGTSNNSPILSRQIFLLRYNTPIHCFSLRPIFMSQSKGQFGFFDLATQLDKIYQINDFLPKLNALIDWEIFRNDLNKVRNPNNPNNIADSTDAIIVSMATCDTISGNPPLVP
jgi:hypothetical protein